ncbi:hypothetical protein ACFWA5_04900 [Streptomyces mirabilis]|uniref:hypothetical protein n=1 Tax=Streptomyces mirabilis TaxID=68239 RepID=UPI003650D253
MPYATPAPLIEVDLNPGRPEPEIREYLIDVHGAEVLPCTAHTAAGWPPTGEVSAVRPPSVPSHWSPSCPSRTSCRPSQ